MNKFKPALLGGLIVGLLSAIPILNYCCCVWAIGGGGLASYLYIKSSPTRVNTGDGAMLGGLAGLIGAVLYLIVGVPISYFVGAAQMEEAMARMNVELPFTGFLLFLGVGLLIGLFLLVLSVIGGLIAVPVFEKRTDAPPPPPPQDFVG
jgi:uncharacterized protein YneF (UPF0154 family)